MSKESISAFVFTVKLFKNIFSMLLYTVIIVELTLLIFGYSFNFELLTKQQFECRAKVRACYRDFVYHGVADGGPCPNECNNKMVTTLEGYYEHNFFTELIDSYYDSKL